MSGRRRVPEVLLSKGAEGGRWRDRFKYPLKESPSASYLQRTEWNVRDSDATVLFSLASELTGGSKKAIEFAKKHHKPWIHLTAGDQGIAQRLKDWLAQNAVNVLNVAGPRASKEREIAGFVILTLDAVFGFLPDPSE